ncbi:MAG: single-stranded DNA-binding protein [Gammaproteobacteria bacterium]|nr:single-stranded DNA-binding protein [Gammaproteobacteria bacterium]
MSDNQSVAALQQQVVKANSPLNIVCVEGVVGENPKCFKGEGGKTSFATFSIGINEAYEKDGELKSKTTWVSIKCYGTIADTVDLCVTKDKHLIVQGKLSA